MQLKVILGFVAALDICNTSFPFVSLLSLKKEAKLKMETVKMLFLWVISWKLGQLILNTFKLTYRIH